MNDKLYQKIWMETAVLAGEIMLVSGAEIYRVEDTINRILKKGNGQTSETIVLSTGIFATLNGPEIQTITVVKRVSDRSTNLNKVYLVNDVSRGLCDGAITVEEAYERLMEIRNTVRYRPWLKRVGFIFVSAFFVLLLGGGFRECLCAGMVGCVLAAVSWLTDRIRLNDFCKNAVCSFMIALTALGLHRWIMPAVIIDTVIISAIMPLVPGVIFTTAVRDTLNGDYSAGAARMLEAVVVALAVAVGVGAGMACFRPFLGGGPSW